MRKKATVLVPGAGGFLGGHLVPLLCERWRVIGVGRCRRPKELDCDWMAVDDAIGALAGTVASTGPDLVIDAAFVNRKPPQISAESYLCELLSVHMRLFEECARLGVPLLLTSSSAVYGGAREGRPLDELAPRNPVSLYGLAKTMQEMAAAHVSRSRGLDLAVVRLFNLLGPGRGLGTVVHDWVSRIARIVDGSAAPVLQVRNRCTSRDFVDPRDAARAIQMLADYMVSETLPRPLTLNVAVGRAVSLRQIGELLACLSPTPYEVVETRPERGTDDVEVQVGDAGRIRTLCGWRPEIDWQTSVTEVWRQYVGKPGELP